MTWLLPSAIPDSLAMPRLKPDPNLREGFQQLALRTEPIDTVSPWRHQLPDLWATEAMAILLLSQVRLEANVSIVSEMAWIMTLGLAQIHRHDQDCCGSDWEPVREPGEALMPRISLGRSRSGRSSPTLHATFSNAVQPIELVLPWPVGCRISYLRPSFLQHWWPSASALTSLDPLLAVALDDYVTARGFRACGQVARR